MRRQSGEGHAVWEVIAELIEVLHLGEAVVDVHGHKCITMGEVIIETSRQFSDWNISSLLFS